jgi:TonB family protein
MKEIEELGKVDLKREQGISRADKSLNAPVASNERAAEIQSRSAGYFVSEAESKLSVPMPAMPEENKELVSSYEVDDVAKDETALSSTEGADLPLAQEKTASADRGGGQSSSEEAGKAIVAGTISDINNKIKQNESVATGGAATETKSTRTAKSAAPSVGTITKSYPENAIVFDRQFSEGGTLRVVVDSTGKLAEVTVYRSSGNPKVDSQAIEAYKKQWKGQVLRQRQTTLYIPFGQKQTDTKND